VSTIALLIPVFFTIVIFFFIVFAQAIRIEIPLAFGRLRGFGRRWPLRLFYTSVIPVILSAALLANFQMWAGMLATKGITFFGTFDAEGNPVSGLAYYIIPPREASLADIVVAALTGVSIPPVAISWITYTIFMIACCILFSVFWVNTAGMDSKTVARQIQRVGLVIPGFRRDVRIIERVLDRYIPYLAVIGGAAVGLLAAFADFTGALGTGTGILLTVMIVFNLYEEISRQHLEDMHPALRRFMG
jgi:preprotein translocase subunit SecY